MKRGRANLAVTGLVSLSLAGAPVAAGVLEPEYDRLGNAIVVSNRYDGETYMVHVAQLARNGAVLRSHPHADGYQEMARAVGVDADGNAVVGGVRYWQGRSFLWLMKYHPSTNWAWEWWDDRPDCVTEAVASNEDGDAWVAGLCGGGAGRALRVARVNGKGSRVWSQVYDLGGARSVRNLEVDFGGRVSATVLVGQGGQPAVRTVVFGAFGERIAEY